MAKKDDPKKLKKLKDAPFDEDMMRARIDEILEEIDMEHCDPGAPCYTLPEMLERKSLAALREMAKMHGLNGYTKKNKEALTAALIKRMWNPDWLSRTLMVAEPFVWKFFLEVVKVKEYAEDGLLIDEYDYLLKAGALALYHADGQFLYIAPQEVKAHFQLLERQGFVEKWEHVHLLSDYATAAANLYGVILLNDLALIFNSQNKQKVDSEELADMLYDFTRHGYGYQMRGPYLVDDRFADVAPGDIDAFARQAAEKTRYMPPQKEFLRYAQWDYFEQTPQIKELKRYLKEILLKDERYLAEELLAQIALLCRAGVPFQAYSNLLEEYEIEYLTVEQAEQLFELIKEIHNNSRMPFNNGHTPEEIYGHKENSGKIMGLRTSTTDPREQKLARNEPCPCGSGKKYKHCCGKS